MRIMAMGKLESILVLRLGRGEDMLEGIRAACIEKEIRNGVILNIIGSLNGAEFYDPIPKPEETQGNGYGDAIRLEGLVEVLIAQGEICHFDDGRLNVHIHATLADASGKAYGGHILGGNKVLNTMNVYIGVIGGVEMGYDIDPEIGVLAFSPREIR